MPDYFSHAICAERIYETCDRQTKSLIGDHTLYMLGAQGGDVFFAYKLSLKKSNLGRRLHSVGAEELFSILVKKNFSYAAGFATHYAMDCTLHPFIYAYEFNAKAPLSHMRLENDVGLFVSRKFGVPRRILPRERILARTFTLYDCIKEFEPSVTVTGVERCLKRHFSYTRALYKSKRQEYALSYDFASLSGAVDEGVALGAECIKRLASGKIDDGTFSRSFLQGGGSPKTLS